MDGPSGPFPVSCRPFNALLPLWFDLARAYRAAGDMSAAIETLEASLRLDQDNAAGWRLFCELAVEAGNLDLARQALQLASILAEGHPELDALRARVAA
jgi:predicted Zn-dependent protease